MIGVLTIVLIPARPLWEYAIKKEIEKGNNVLVVAHTNTLRGLMKHIDNIEGAFLDFLRIMWKFLICKLMFATLYPFQRKMSVKSQCLQVFLSCTR